MVANAHRNKNNKFTSGTVVSYGVFTKTGGLSLTSETRTIIGMFRLRRVDTTVHDICNLNNIIVMYECRKRKKRLKSITN